jgi:formate hydrogenlyase subunit 3/multisubunit Na+/H+ antiporter MnhD subunit
MKKVDQDIQLNRFHGYGYEYPVTGFLFLMSSFGLLGLPFTPTFIGIDLLISHIHKSEIFIIILTAFSFLLMEIAILRIYARVFMGLHKKHSHAMAYRSS